MSVEEHAEAICRAMGISTVNASGILTEVEAAMIAGAEAMREAAAKAVLGYIHPDYMKYPGEAFASAQVANLDPATIMKDMRP